MNRILLIDGNSLVYRAFYGSAYGPQGILTNSNGIPVNAIIVFNRMISKAFKKYNPTHVFVAFDAGKKTKRHDKLKSYKGGRKATPEELIKQFPIVKEMLDVMGIKRFEIPEIEADDIIGALAKKFENENEILVMSSDRDLYQLVSENVSIVVPQNASREDKVIQKHDFEIQMGYLPSQVIDMKGLVGDASDKLPGVKGVGEKGAIKLLNKYKNLENIYENIEDHTENLKQKLIASKEIAFLSKELATLECDVEVPINLNDLFYKEFSSNDIIDFFKNLEINSLTKKYKELMKNDEKTDNNKKNIKNNFNNIIL